MAAYIVFIRNSISDPEAMKTYGGLAAKAFSPKMKALAVYGPIETLEGQPSDGLVLIEFPTMEDAKEWYNGPAYQEALQHRLKGADYRVLMFQGV